MPTLQWFNGQVAPEAVSASATMLNSTVDMTTLITEAAVYDAVPNTVTTGALGVTTRTTFISIDGTKAYTLANGTFEGQRKNLRCTVAANVPAGTVTPATASGFTSVLFDAVEDCIELEWHAGGWRLCFCSGAAVT